MDDTLVAVGRIGKAHGLKGEVSVEAWTDDPEDRFSVGTVFSTEPTAEPRGPVPSTLTVLAARVHSGRWLVSFEGVDDRNAAEAVRGTRLLLAARERPVLEDPDDFYDSDLVGLSARTSAGESVGSVVDVVHSAGGDYLVLDRAGREHLIPFVSEFVPVVDLAAGFAIVDAPEGLFDL